MKNRLIDYLIILIISLIILIPMFNENVNIYIDDGIQHIARLMGTYQTITDGDIPPVIMSNFCNGFGYSWNIFYSPFTAYVPLIFSLITNSFELMLKIFIGLVGLVSGIAMYEFVKKITDNRYAALLAAGIYILAPYRFTDIYNRVAISELTSFMFLPIVFHGMYNIFNSDCKTIPKSLVLAFGASGLILTHSVIAMYTAIFCVIYLFVNIKKLKDKTILKLLIINILLIILLTSFYTIPLLEHKLNTQYEVFKEGRMGRTDALIYNKVDFIDLLYTNKNNFSFEIGLVTLIGLILTLLAYKKIDNRYKTIYYFSLIAGIMCIIFSLRIFPFEKLPSVLKMIQFTFRILEFSTFFFAIVAAINYSLIIKNFGIKDVLVLLFIATLLLYPLTKNIKYNKIWSEEKLWPAIEVNNNTGRVHAGCATFEYLPSKAFENLDYIINREDRVYLLDGKADIYNENKNGTNMSFEISNVEENTVIEFPYIWYLGYDVILKNDNNEIQKLEIYESDNGFVATKLPAIDNGIIEIEYNGTIIMKISICVSILTLLSLIIYIVYIKIRKEA